MALDISAVMSQAANLQNLADQSAVGIAENYSRMGEYSDQIANLIAGGTDRNGDTPLSLETRELGLLQAQKKNLELYQTIGMGGEGAAKISNQLAATLLQSVQESQVAAAKLAKAKSTQLLDDPLDWLYNQVFMPDIEAEAAGAMTKVKTAAEGMQSINTFMQQTAKTENDYAEVRTQASIDSKVTGLKNSLDAESAKVRLASLRDNVNEIESVFRMNAQQLQIEGQKLQAQHTANTEVRQDEESKLRKAQIQEHLEAFKEKEEGKVLAAQYINHALRSQVPAGTPYRELTPAEVQRLLDPKLGNVSKQYQKLLEMGATAVHFNAGRVLLGDNPAEALMMQQALNVPVPEAQKPAYDIATTAYKQAELAGVNPKDKVAFESEAHKQGKALVKGYQDNINPLDKTNPLSAPPLSVLAENSGVRDSAFYQKVVAPQVATGMKETDPARLWELGKEAIKSGVITPSQFAEGYTNMFVASAKLRSSSLQLDRWGLPEQTAYYTKVPTVGFISTGAKAVAYAAGGAGVLSAVASGGILAPAALVGTGAALDFAASRDSKLNVMDRVAVDQAMLADLIASAPMKALADRTNFKALTGVGADALSPIFK